MKQIFDFFNFAQPLKLAYLIVVVSMYVFTYSRYQNAVKLPFVSTEEGVSVESRSHNSESQIQLQCHHCDYLERELFRDSESVSFLIDATT